MDFVLWLLLNKPKRNYYRSNETNRLGPENGFSEKEEPVIEDNWIPHASCPQCVDVMKKGSARASSRLSTQTNILEPAEPVNRGRTASLRKVYLLVVYYHYSSMTQNDRQSNWKFVIIPILDLIHRPVELNLQILNDWQEKTAFLTSSASLTAKLKRENSSND